MITPGRLFFWKADKEEAMTCTITYNRTPYAYRVILVHGHVPRLNTSERFEALMKTNSLCFLRKQKGKAERLYFIITKPEGAKLVQCRSQKSCCDRSFWETICIHQILGWVEPDLFPEVMNHPAPFSIEESASEAET